MLIQLKSRYFYEARNYEQTFHYVNKIQINLETITELSNFYKQSHTITLYISFIVLNLNNSSMNVGMPAWVCIRVYNLTYVLPDFRCR